MSHKHFSIEERPPQAENRTEIGHFESDTVIGAGRKGAIATHVDRKSIYLVAAIIPDRKCLSLFLKNLLKLLLVIMEKNLLNSNKYRRDLRV